MVVHAAPPPEADADWSRPPKQRSLSKRFKTAECSHCPCERHHDDEMREASQRPEPLSMIPRNHSASDTDESTVGQAPGPDEGSRGGEDDQDHAQGASSQPKLTGPNEQGQPTRVARWKESQKGNQADRQRSRTGAIPLELYRHSSHGMPLGTTANSMDCILAIFQ